MEQVTRVEESTKKALGISTKNEADIRKIELKQQSLKDEITEELAFNVKEELKEEFNSKKLETQLKGAKPNKTWEDTSKILAEFLRLQV